MDEIKIILPNCADENNVLDLSLVTLTEAISQIDDDKVAHGVLGGEFGYGAHWDNEIFTMRPYYWGDCDCGWEQVSNKWSYENKHLATCYWTFSYAQIDASPLQEQREAAIHARNALPFNSMASAKAQIEVERVCAALKDFEASVRRNLCEQHNIPWNEGFGSAVHCSCGHEENWRSFYEDYGGHKATCALELPNFLHKASGLRIEWYKWIGRDMTINNPNNADIAAVFRECMASVAASTPVATT